MTTTLTTPVPARAQAPTSFADLGVPALLVRSLAATGIDSPFPIQAATLPDSLAGTDVLGKGRTGSGKTLAFSIPLVARLAASRAPRRPGRPRGLVLCPTRELANQIAAVVRPLAEASGLTVTTVFGGVSQNPQASALRAGTDIVIACPGRLEDLMGQGIANLDAVEITVLDEADHMADLGFLPGVRRIMSATPKRGQRLLFSATLDNGVDRLVTQFLHAPTVHEVASGPVGTMTHHVFQVADADAKRDVVEHLASGRSRRLLFTRTKHQAKRLAKQLTAAGIPTVDLHGNLSQGARERNLAAFASGEVLVMAATDVAARGIHVDDVDLVVHVDPPAEHKAYTHRSGRTARAGAGGDVVTIVLPEQRGEMQTLARQAKITARPTAVHVESAELRKLVGPPAERREPVAPAPVAGQPARSNGRGRGARGRQARPETPATTTGRTSGQTRASSPARAAAPARTSSPARAAAPARGAAPARALPAFTSNPNRAGNSAGERTGRQTRTGSPAGRRRGGPRRAQG